MANELSVRLPKKLWVNEVELRRIAAVSNWINCPKGQHFRSGTISHSRNRNHSVLRL